MDPTTCLSEIIDGLNDGDISDEFVEKCEALHKWIKEGGFLPTQKVGHGLTKNGYLVFLTGILGYWGDPDQREYLKAFAKDIVR